MCGQRVSTLQAVSSRSAALSLTINGRCTVIAILVGLFKQTDGLLLLATRVPYTVTLST